MVKTAEPVAFDGFPSAAFSWLAGLAADNSKRYFALHRQTYDRDVRGALEALLEELADEFGGRVKVFRQHRDVRFSPDKSPYKTRTYGVILDRPGSHAALYAELSAAGLFAGTGYHVLASDQLARFREAVADSTRGPELGRAIAGAETAGVEIFGEALKTAPRGYPRDHPRLRLLRHRSLIAGRRAAAGSEGIGRDAALRHTRDTWSACAPINAWLDANVAVSELPVR
ncbi:MAG: DUF2461 family protein [Solirubrobacteraceae bacterium]